MNDEVKEILIDLVDYYNAMGTDKDPGINTLENVVKRSSKALKRNYEKRRMRSGDIDPFAMDVVGNTKQLKLKLEEEW